MAETGHARNVANFATLISFCVGYGGDYKPTNALIEIPAMQALLATAQAALIPTRPKTKLRAKAFRINRMFRSLPRLARSSRF